MALSQTCMRFLCVLLYVRSSVQECTNSSFYYTCDSLNSWPTQAKKIVIAIKSSSKLQTFNAVDSKIAENVIELSFLSSIINVSKGAFDNFKHLENLGIINNKLSQIEVGVFQIEPLRILHLGNNLIESIDAGAFEKLPNLKTLVLFHNDLTIIARESFKGLKKLQSLHLSYNQIYTIETGAFHELAELEDLKLDKNRLTNFIASEIFNCTHCNLQVLELNNNFITQINQRLFRGLKNLKKLSLAHNMISEIASESFLETLRLEQLSLNYNLITILDGSVFSTGLDSLRELKIGYNKLSYLSTNFFTRFRGIKKVQIGGNPWQCSCLDLVLRQLRWIVDMSASVHWCDLDYFNGKRPVCVATGTHLCQYLYDDNHYWSYYYNNNMYPKINSCS